MNGFTALLLTQRFLEIGPCTPICENSLIPLPLGIDQGGRLLQQVAEQDGLLRIRFLLISHLFRFGIADGFCDRRCARASRRRLKFEFTSRRICSRVSSKESPACFS